MALKLPEHSHCAYCGDPIPFDRTYCSEECLEKHKRETRRTNIRDIAFYVTVGVALCVLAFRFMF